MSKCLIDGYCECNDSCEIYECDSLKMYQRGIADRDREIAESNVFFSNRPIEEIVLEAVESERERIVRELIKFAENPCEGDYCKHPNDENIGCEQCVALRAIEIARGGE